MVVGQIGNLVLNFADTFMIGHHSTMELADAIHTLECFFEHDGSITKTAAALYIHKNTLQQHLKKIALRTGYDPRSLRSSAVFYVVLYFYQDIHLTGFSKA